MAPRKAPHRKANNRVQARLDDDQYARWIELRESAQLGDTAIIREFLNKGLVKDGTRELVMRELAKLTFMVRRDPEASAYLRGLIRKIAGKAS